LSYTGHVPATCVRVTTNSGIVFTTMCTRLKRKLDPIRFSHTHPGENRMSKEVDEYFLLGVERARDLGLMMCQNVH
ncbi:MAG: hypothetical protein ACFFB3_14115, partial [Candidatus Hodarchaeota archaeon]